MPHLNAPEDAGYSSVEDMNKIRLSDGDKHVSEMRLDMQKAMQADVAVFRTHDSLTGGLERVQQVEQDFVNRLQ
ncbi:hypothetical protein LTR16_012673, partial [Cryomyces antarcticus]